MSRGALKALTVLKVLAGIVALFLVVCIVIVALDTIGFGPFRRDRQFPPAAKTVPVTTTSLPPSKQPPGPPSGPSPRDTPKDTAAERAGTGKEIKPPPPNRVPFRLRVFSRDRELFNGQSFEETDPELGELEPNAIKWELRAEAWAGPYRFSMFGPGAEISWYIDGRRRGGIELTKEHLNGRHGYPQYPEPGSWQIRLEGPRHPAVVLFRFTIRRGGSQNQP
jgi:hypothetical protein